MNARNNDRKHNTWTFTLLVATLAVIGSLTFASAPAEAKGKPGGNGANLADLQIIEGQGVGDLVTLGMSRSAAMNVAANGNCDSAASCAFRLSPETAAITVYFGAGDRVDFITVNQNGLSPENKWSTTAGAIDGMSLSEVAALYADAEIAGGQVRSEAAGYAFSFSQTCSYFGCSSTYIHSIFEATTEPTTGEAGFEGQIVLENPSTKTKTYSVELEIVSPDGELSTTDLSATIPGNGSISCYPGDFVSADGELGDYEYTATLVDRRGRVKGSSYGTFSLQ